MRPIQRLQRALWLLPLTILTACGGGGSGGGSPSSSSVQGLTQSGFLASVRLSDAATTLRTGPGTPGFPGLRAIAFDAHAGVLYGVALASQPGAEVLLRIDATPGPRGLASQPIVVGEISPSVGAGCLAWHAGEQKLYGVQLLGSQPWNPAQLVRIDPATAESEVVGNCSRATSLAYDPLSNMLYGVSGDSFDRIHPATGASIDLFSESFYLPKSSGLAFDPPSGLFYAGFHDLATPPGIITIDLFGNVTPVSALDDPLDDLVMLPHPGKLIGLTTGKSLLSITPAGSQYATQHLGNVGFQTLAMGFDPWSGSYFGMDLEENLIRFWPSGGCRTIGPVEGQIRSLAYDSILRELWGIDAVTRHPVEIDTTTAEVLHVVTGITVSAGSKLDFSGTAGRFLGQDGGNGVTWQFDSIGESLNVASNAHGITGLQGLTRSKLDQDLIAAWSPTLGPSRISKWDPFVSGAAPAIATLDVTLSALGWDASLNALHGFALSGEMFELDLNALRPAATLGSVRQRNFTSCVYVPTIDRIYAIDGTDVYSIEPLTGSTRVVGSQPDGGGASAITWNPETEWLGFLKGGEILWASSPSAPWIPNVSTGLGTADVEALAHAPERGVFYAVGDGGVVSIAVNASGASVITVSAVPPPADVRDAAWRNGALWVSTAGPRLYRVDPDSGVWEDRGRPSCVMSGLY